MLGRLNETQREAIIIGAGFSGLLAAYRLLQRGWKISLYDAAPIAGGLIQTWQTPLGISESAAHTIRSSPAMDALFKELGLETATARTKKKYILRGSRFCSLPLNFFEICELLARACFLPAKAHYETLADWALRHAGRGALNHIFYPMLHGIYAAAAHELSPYLVFPKLVPPKGKTLLQQVLATHMRSKYKPQVIAPREGMAALTNALFQTILAHPNAKIFLGQKISELPDAPNVIITTPAPAAAEILKTAFPKSTRALAAIHYAPMIAATVFLDKKTHHAPSGIGVLCAAHEGRRALGILFNSSTFAGRVRYEANVASYTVMLGGTSDAEVMALPDDEIEKIIMVELQVILKLSGPPLEIIIHRWPQAIPVYSPELLAAHEVLKNDFCAKPGRVIFANYTGQISLRGMADTV